MAKVLSQSEWAGIEVKQAGLGSRRMHPEAQKVMDLIKSVSILQAVDIERTDWPYKSEPSGVISHWAKRNGKKFSLRSKKDGTGWIVIRTA